MSKKRSALSAMVACLLTALLLAACSPSANSSSKSYKDGYQNGYASATHGGGYPNGQEACPDDLGVIYPGGDNGSEFMSGCIAGYNDGLANKPSAIGSSNSTNTFVP
jgi:hypothetical protein